jgi:hypothetical protein
MNSAATARVDASHLTNINDVAKEPWDVKEQEVQPRNAAPVEPPRPVATNAGTDPLTFFAQFNEMKARAKQELAALASEINGYDAKVEEFRKKVEVEKVELINKYNQMANAVGEANFAVVTPNAEPKRRGRRKRGVSDGTTPDATTTTPEVSTSTGRRTRPKNDKTLKEAIVEVLTKRGRVDLNTISNEILNSGFKTNSKKFANTVRVQLYRLDDDKEITIYDDGTFEMRAK